MTIAPPAPGTFPAVALEPLFGDGGADEVIAVAHSYGSHKMYSAQEMDHPITKGLFARHDAVANFLRTGGRLGRSADDRATLGARTNYFREDYAYGEEAATPGIDRFLHHPGFVDAAREVFGLPIIEPAIVFANFFVPGQELAVHTDVPEFRGCNRRVMPQWLLAAMHHSGLFDAWRMPIATGIAWFHDCDGGALSYWPEGADGPVVVHPVRKDTALVLDTDSVFHGVDPLATAVEMPPLRPGMSLRHVAGPVGDDAVWAVIDEGDALGNGVGSEVARYAWSQLRFSVSWKAYCFADEAEREAWRAHDDDLTIDRVLEVMMADLRERGVLGNALPPHPGVAEAIIDTYIQFPR